MKFIDLFCGIGGFRTGMEQAGHECVWSCEIDKYARQSYAAIFGGEPDASDIRAVTDDTIRGIGTIDCICGGFPCQSFSIAGKRGGFDDTRGTLFFEIMRFANLLRPSYLFLENVEGLLSHDEGNTFETILRTLDEGGYDAEWDVLNSKDYGVPQNRKRVFIVCHLRGRRTRKIFPVGTANPTINSEYRVKSLGNVNPSGNGMNGEIYDSSGLSPTLTTNKGEGLKIVIQKTHGNSTTVNYGQIGTLQAARLDKVPMIVEPIAVLTPDRAEKRQNGRRMKEPGEPMFTLTAQDIHGVALKFVGGISDEPNWLDDGKNLSRNYKQGSRVYDSEGLATSLSAQGVGGLGGFSGLYKVPQYRIRKLTPLECWRLQGQPDENFYNAKAAGVSDSQLYKQAGNSVTCSVIYEIASRMEMEV